MLCIFAECKVNKIHIRYFTIVFVVSVQAVILRNSQAKILFSYDNRRSYQPLKQKAFIPLFYYFGLDENCSKQLAKRDCGYDMSTE